MKQNELISILKAQQWEKCKGELKAFLALAVRHQTIPERNFSDEYQELKQIINIFICEVEVKELYC